MDRATAARLRDDDALNGTQIRETVIVLSEIWDELGFDGNARTERLEQVGFHFRQLTDKMVDEEKNVLQNIKTVIADYEENIRNLNIELGNPQFQYHGPPEVMQKESALSNELKRLETAKEKRMVILFELKTQEQQLCDKLVVTPAYVPADKIPTSYDLDIIRDNIKKMEKLKQERWDEFESLKRDICHSYDIIGETPSEPFTQDIIRDEPDSFVAVNPDNLEELRATKRLLDERREERTLQKDFYYNQILPIARRLKRSESYMANLQKNDLSEDWIMSLKAELTKLEVEKIAKLKDLVESCREEIANIWDKMYFSQEQRENFIEFYSEEYTEELLTRHEEECAKLNQRYDEHRNMFDGVDQWTALFERYRDLKNREKDPNRFKNNRNGALLKQQKEMGAVKKKLPTLEQHLVDDIQEWEKEHEQTFIVDGVGFIQYIQSQWAAVADNEKIERTVRNTKKT